MARIDAHVHVFARESNRFPRAADRYCPGDREETAEKLLAIMDSHGIDGAVLVQIGGNEIEHHSYLIHCLEQFPDRFRGIAAIAPATANPEALMDQLLETPGLIGFRLFAVGGPRDPFAPVVVEELETYPIWGHAAANDLVIWLYPPATQVHLVPYLLEAFPKVRVVLNHLGVCPGEGQASRDEKGRPRIEAPEYNPAFHTSYRFSKYENVAVKLSGQYAFSREEFPYRDLARWHERLFASYGSKRLMWASDFPWILEDPGYGPLTTVIREQLPDLSAVEHADIMGDTAKHFLRFPGS
jgi:L-fuconolactonase